MVVLSIYTIWNVINQKKINFHKIKKYILKKTFVSKWTYINKYKSDEAIDT